MVGDALLTQIAAAVGRDEQVVLQAYAAEVAVLFHQVEVNELGIVSAALPVVDQGGDEVDAGP